MAPAERRPVFGGRKERRPHPASPAAAVPVESRSAGSRSSGDEAPTDRPVMLCARVTGSLRQRIKLVAVQTGRSVQDLVAEALEGECGATGGGRACTSTAFALCRP